MAAMVIFWTADLRVTASTRIGASSLVVANPAPSCWRTGTAGRALTRLIKETATLAGSSAANGADESSGAIIGVSQAASTFNPLGCLRTR